MEGKRFLCINICNPQNSSCLLGGLPAKQIDRDAFFAAISASVELKEPFEETGSRTAGVWQEHYEIVGDKPPKLSLHSIGGTLASATIFTEMPRSRRLTP
jgi:hypothetical protein